LRSIVHNNAFVAEKLPLIRSMTDARETRGNIALLTFDWTFI